MFAVDLDLLDETIASLVRCGAALDDRLHEAERRVAELHAVWSGAAADAQSAAQAEWEAGFHQMREALASMRTAGQVAHGNYLDAATTNLRMWEQVS
jgi:WXG100 family type VII secretion target